MEKYNNMNAYEIVDTLIHKEYRRSISENELKRMPEGKVVLAILEQHYNAKFYPSDDFHFCGDYSFDNPHYTDVKAYSLQSYTFDDLSNKNEFYPLIISKDFNHILDEIIRLEGWDIKIYKKKTKPIRRDDVKINLIQRGNSYVFVGNERLWLIKETTIKELPKNKD